MGTTIRPEVSIKNRYHIDKHRHYELKHFCLQYPIWKKIYVNCLDRDMSLSMIDGARPMTGCYDPDSCRTDTRKYYSSRMQLIEQTAKEADQYLWYYILKGVTEGLSYTYLKTKMNIPCGKDMYYDRYRRFFWLLSEVRD